MGGSLLVMPGFALQGVNVPGESGMIAAAIGLGIAFVFRTPKDWREALQLIGLSLGGLVLYALAIGGVDTWGTPNTKKFVANPHTRAALVGCSIALGSFLWGTVNETAQDAKGMNVFELLAWIKSGGKQLPKRLKKS